MSLLRPVGIRMLAAFRPTARAKTCYKTAPFSHLTCADAGQTAANSQPIVFKGHCMRKCTPKPPYRAFNIQRKPTHSFVSRSRSPKTQLQPDKGQEGRLQASQRPLSFPKPLRASFDHRRLLRMLLPD